VHVLKVRGWHIAALVLAVSMLVVLGAADGAWWHMVIAGAPLKTAPLALSELPPALVEAYGRSRWVEGVDALLDPGGDYLYVLIRWGQRPTGGYRVIPEDAHLIRRFGRCEIRVRARYVVPDPGQPVIEVASFPAAGVRLTVRGFRVAGCTVKAVDPQGRCHGVSGPLQSGGQ